MPTQRASHQAADDLYWAYGPTDLRPLAPWAAWLRNLGGMVAAQTQTSDERLTIVVTLPTRDLAALLVLLGITENLYERNPDPTSHWEMLKQLPVGTPVRRFDGRFYVSSQVRGIETRNGVPHLDLGGTKRRWDKCLDVQPLAPGEDTFIRRRASEDTSSLNYVLEGVDPLTYLSSSSPLSVAVCSKSVLENELNATSLTTTPPLGAASATQIIRPRLHPGALYRTDVVSTTSDLLPERAKANYPVAVFDGGNAVLRWRNLVKSACKIMLLDRSAASTDAAIEAVMADRARSLRDSTDTFPAPPSGIEALAFIGRR